MLFQALVGSLEQKINETEKKYEETKKMSEERLKQAIDAESLIMKLKSKLSRFLRLIKLINIIVSV